MKLFVEKDHTNCMLYHITCNTDDNYAQHCCAMLCSLFENNKECGFHVHVLTHSLSEKNSDEIGKFCSTYGNKYTIYEVDESRLDGVKFRKERPLTKAAYYRILLPEILDETIERVLYLDCDMIVVGSVKELFDLELDGYALAATLDCMPYNSTHRKQLQFEVDERSFCSGIMMINLAYWKEHNAVNRLLEYSKREKSPIYLHDQDSLNYVFKKQWYLLPPKWNKPALSFFPDVRNQQYFDTYEYVYEPVVIHFSSSMKPWFKMSFPYSDLYVKYLRMSGFPNPVFQQVPLGKRMSFEMLKLRYYVRKNILPFMPRLAMILISDIVKYLHLLVALTSKSRLRNYMLTEGLKALKS